MPNNSKRKLRNVAKIYIQIQTMGHVVIQTKYSRWYTPIRCCVLSCLDMLQPKSGEFVEWDSVIGTSCDAGDSCVNLKRTPPNPMQYHWIFTYQYTHAYMCILNTIIIIIEAPTIMLRYGKSHGETYARVTNGLLWPGFFLPTPGGGPTQALVGPACLPTQGGRYFEPPRPKILPTPI